MIIKLPWIDPIDTNNVPVNFDELVKESFKNFTNGTSKDYTFEDKLQYIDNLRSSYLRNDSTQEAIEKIIGETCAYRLREYGELPSEEEILDIEFMEQCYDMGFRPLRDTWDKFSHSRNTEILKLILRIIQIIVNFENEEVEESEE